MLKLEDFSRWQIDVPLLVGTSTDWFRVWAGPKLMFTTFETSLILDLSFEGKKELGRFDGTATYVGAQAGFAIGFRYLFLAAELTMAELIGDAHLTALGMPVRDVDISSFVIYPSIGLMAQF